MSIQEKKKEAEAVLDSAEMVLETIPEPRTGKAKDLEVKINKLEQEIQEPDSESSLDKLIEEIRELMDEVQADAMGQMGPEEDMGGGMGPGGAGGTGGAPPPGGPEDEPPF